MVDLSSSSGGLIEHGFDNSVFIIPAVVIVGLAGEFSSYALNFTTLKQYKVPAFTIQFTYTTVILSRATPHLLAVVDSYLKITSPISDS